jgi:adenylate kinase
MRIIITGTPGTGKSTISSILSQKTGVELIRIADVVRKKMHLGPKHEVDVKRLSKHLRFLNQKRDSIVEGHLACEMKLPADHIIVLRTDPSILKKRMKKRGYGKLKIEENLMAEMLDYCSQRVQKEYKKKPLELDTTKRSAAASANKILASIKQKKKKIDSVDYSKQLITFLRLNHGG